MLDGGGEGEGGSGAGDKVCGGDMALLSQHPRKMPVVVGQQSPARWAHIGCAEHVDAAAGDGDGGKGDWGCADGDSSDNDGDGDGGDAARDVPGGADVVGDDGARGTGGLAEAEETARAATMLAVTSHCGLVP